MAFQHVKSLIAGAVEIAAPKDNTSYTLASGVDSEVGEVFYFNAGELTLAVNGQMKAAVVAIEASAAAGSIRAGWITPGMVYRAPITDKDGTALTTLHATFKVGGTAQINDTGNGVDGETANDGVGEPLTIVKVDTVNETVDVVFNSCAMAFDTAQV